MPTRRAHDAGCMHDRGSGAEDAHAASARTGCAGARAATYAALAVAVAVGLPVCPSRAVAQASGARRPTEAVVERLVGAALAARGGGGPFDLLGRAIEAGEGRYVAVVAVAEAGHDDEGAVGLRAAVIVTGPANAGVAGAGPAGAGPAGSIAAGTPTLAALLELPTVGAWGYFAPRGGVEEGSVPAPRVLASRLDDWDDDGQPELELVVQYNGPQVCGVGTTAYRHVYVVDPGAASRPGTPRVAAALLTQTDPEADTLEQTMATVLHEDADGDGHRDLVLRSRVCALADVEAAERTCAPPTREVFRWDATRDAWMNVAPSDPAAPCDEGEMGDDGE